MYYVVSMDITRSCWEGFFKGCCTFNTMDETDNDVLYNDSDVDGNFRSECKEDEHTDCEVGDSDTDW